MGRRWTEQDVSELKHLAQRYSAPRIAELTNRTAGGVAFKAYQLKLPLRPSRHESEPGAGAQEATGTDWAVAGDARTETR